MANEVRPLVTLVERRIYVVVGVLLTVGAVVIAHQFMDRFWIGFFMAGAYAAMCGGLFHAGRAKRAGDRSAFIGWSAIALLFGVPVGCGGLVVAGVMLIWGLQAVGRLTR